MSDKTPELVIEQEVASLIKREKQLADIEAELSQDKKFQEFLKLQKEVPAQIDQAWKQIQEHMTTAHIKSLKGDWGSITIAERLNWIVDSKELPAEFFKKVVDTTKLSTVFRLEGKAIKGATPSYSSYLTKRIK